MPHSTDATRDLRRSLRASTWALPLSFSSPRRCLNGPSSITFFASLEVFFALLGVVLVFQAAPDFVLQSSTFAAWHMVFAVLTVFNSCGLIYSGIRREVCPLFIHPPLYIAYGAYLTYPFALLPTATSSIPWCSFIGLFGLITPLIMCSHRWLVTHTIGLCAAFSLSVQLAELLTGIPPENGDFYLTFLLLVSYTLLLAFFFYGARFYTAHSDELYSKTLNAHLKFNRSKEQAQNLQEFDKLVHDNVMAALLDASRVPGPIADRTRALAQRAIGVLEEESNRTGQEQGNITFQQLTEKIAAGVAPWNSRLRFVEHRNPGLPKANPDSAIPHEAARAFTHAVTEAVSNSARHSGTRTTLISIHTELRRPASSSRSEAPRPHIYCRVEDRGRGFNLKNLDMRRMGVRVSMVRSMEEAGGKAQIKSAPDKGTIVTIQWPGE